MEMGWWQVLTRARDNCWSKGKEVGALIKWKAHAEISDGGRLVALNGGGKWRSATESTSRLKLKVWMR